MSTTDTLVQLEPTVPLIVTVPLTVKFTVGDAITKAFTPRVAAAEVDDRRQGEGVVARIAAPAGGEQQGRGDCGGDQSGLLCGKNVASGLVSRVFMLIISFTNFIDVRRRRKARYPKRRDERADQ